MSITISIDPAGLKALEAKLSKIEARIPEAIAQGLNEGGDRVRTQVQRALKQQTGLLKLQSVTRRVSTQRAYAGGAASAANMLAGEGSAYVIHVHGKPSTHITEFAYKVKTGPGGFVSAKMWGVDHVFKRSFQIKGGAGMSGLRARLSKDRTPIRGFDGPNLAKELTRGITPSVFILSTAEFVPPIILKKLSRVLAGGGK